MSNRTSLELFSLIKSMSKTEKKQFYQLASRNNTVADAQLLSVYRALNDMKVYDHNVLPRRVKNVQPHKLSAVKNQLYELLLESLRQHDDSELVQLHQLLDYATLLYQKRFYDQALKATEKLKRKAMYLHQVNILLLSVSLEKKILIIDDCPLARIEQLNKDMEHYTQALRVMGELSNLGMMIYGYYARYGSFRNDDEAKQINAAFEQCKTFARTSFYAELYYQQAATYFYLLQNDSRSVTATRSWLALFEQFPEMKNVEAQQYRRCIYFLSEANGSADQYIKAADSNDFYGLAIALNACINNNSIDEQLLEKTFLFIGSLSDAEQKIILCYKAAVICLAAKMWKLAHDFVVAGLSGKNAYRIDLQTKLRQYQINLHEAACDIELAACLLRSKKRFVQSHLQSSMETN